MRKTITEEQIKDVYKKFKEYYFENSQEILQKKAAHIVNAIKEQIIREDTYHWNDASLSDYINNLIYMIKGERFARTLSKFAQNFFIENICKDFDDTICKNAKKAIEEHKEYYSKLTKKTHKNLNVGYFVDSQSNNIKDSNKLTKNLILYGPPGVGKTYNHKKIVSLIENGQHSQKKLFDSIIQNQSEENIDSTFEIIKNEGRVEFITFHQSFSYEDFIEGYRPNEEGKIELEDGIFKRISDRALNNQLLSAKSDLKITFDKAFEILFENITEDMNIKIPLKREGNYFNIYDFTEKTIFFEKQNGDRSHSLSIKTLKRIYDHDQNDIIKGGLANYYEAIIRVLKKIASENKSSEKTELKNYYLVIDEINRGNISKIFGELITLIEEDKRDSIEVTLPYSKESFKVPSNLYIIATMNSTDKSIALIDIALRRRFTFLKMHPNSKFIKDEEAKRIFNDLNTFILEKLGEDFQIGHSYFMNYDDLYFVLDYKIRPLLEEYFFADSDGLNEALKIIGRDDL